MANSDFGRDIAEVYRDIKGDFARKEHTVREIDAGVPVNHPIDKSVREQVNSDIDKLIEKHSARKPYPGQLP